MCGAIHRAAGPELARAAAVLGGCPTGEARLTPGFALPTRFVIHAVGPACRGGREGEAELLARCYQAALDLAAAAGVRSIAFPAISTGIYGFPLDEATRIAVETVRGHLPQAAPLERVRFVCFSERDLETYRQALRSRPGHPPTTR